MTVKRFTILLVTLLLMFGSITVGAQDNTPVAEDTPTATAEATPEAVVIPEVSPNDAFKEVLEIGNQMGEASGIFKGAGIGSLFTLAMVGLFLTLLIRSTVVQTIIEGLIYSRLDQEAIKRIHGTGAIFKEVGTVIERVTDGLPNDVTTITTQTVVDTGNNPTFSTASVDTSPG